MAQEEWITAAVRGPKIIDERTFARAQQVYRDRTDQKSDEQLLEALQTLWRKNGNLNEYMIDASRLTPSVNTYRRRFGRLSRAFQLIRYRQPKSRILQKIMKSRRSSSRLRRELIRLLQSMFPRIVIPGHYDGYIHCPEASLDVAVLVCRATRIRRQTEWSVSPRRDQNNTVTLLCLLNESNDRLQSFYVFPRLQVRHGFRIYKSSNLLSQGKKLHSLREFYRAVIDAHRQLPPSDQVREPVILIGVPQISRHLGQSLGIVRRLIREGMPVARQGRCPTAIPEQITEWVRRNGTAWNPARDRFGRYLPGGVQVPISRAAGKLV